MGLFIRDQSDLIPLPPKKNNNNVFLSYKGHVLSSQNRRISEKKKVVHYVVSFILCTAHLFFLIVDLGDGFVYIGLVGHFRFFLLQNQHLGVRHGALSSHHRLSIFPFLTQNQHVWA